MEPVKTGNDLLGVGKILAFLISKSTEHRMQVVAGHPMFCFPDLGVWFLLPVKDFEYGEKYFEHYEKFNETAMEKALTQHRMTFMMKLQPICKEHLDVGIGSGQFVKKFVCYGTDVNPKGLEFLEKHKAMDDGRKFYKSMSFWDTLEHVADPTHLLDRTEAVAISCPIYQNEADVLSSRHFKPSEHLWFWTEEGLALFMSLWSYELVSKDNFESRLGRHAIGTFSFRKTKPSTLPC